MIPDWAKKAFSGHSNEQLGKLAEREAARAEIENTRWYKMLVGRLEEEVRWSERELRSVDILHFQSLQAYAKALELVDGFIRASRNGTFAGELLSERAEKNKKKTVDEHMDEIFGVKS